MTRVIEHKYIKREQMNEMIQLIYRDLSSHNQQIFINPPTENTLEHDMLAAAIIAVADNEEIDKIDSHEKLHESCARRIHTHLSRNYNEWQIKIDDHLADFYTRSFDDLSEEHRTLYRNLTRSILDNSNHF